MVLDVCYVSLGGLTEPPEPPLDPPQLFPIVIIFARIHVAMY